MNTHHINIIRLANAQKSVPVFVGAIADLNVTAYDDTTITLDWTTPSADNPIDYYEVWVDNVFYENTTDDTEGWVVTGLTAGTSYNIKLKTVDTLGNKSGFSNAVTQSTTGGVSPIYNGVSVIYTLRRPAMTTLWTNAVLKIRRSLDNTTAFVFFNGSAVNDTISTASFISTSSNTTPDATTLGTWLGANDAFVETWFGITDNNTIDTGKRAIQTTTSLQPKFATAGVLITKGSKIAIDFLAGTRYLEATTNTSLNSGNAFTSLTVSSNNNSSSAGAIWCSSNINNNFIQIINDTRAAQKRLIYVLNGTYYFSDLLSAQSGTGQKLISATVDSSKNQTGYFNGAIQNTVAYSGTYTNNAFFIGLREGGTSYLDGTIQEIIIFPSDKTSDLATLHAEMNAYYSIY